MIRTATAVNPSPPGTTAGISFFAAFWVILVVGCLLHWLIDRHRNGRRPHRTPELLLIWVVVFGGIWTILDGYTLISGDAHRSAVSIGYVPSMYEWEVGWADIAIGFLGAACVRKTLRGQWMTAAVAVLAIAFGGDAIGHITQWTVHNNTAPVNVWAIPFDILQGGLGVVLLIIYRRLDSRAPRQRSQPTNPTASPLMQTPPQPTGPT